PAPQFQVLAPRSSSSVCAEIRPELGRYHSHERLRKEPIAKKPAHKQRHRNAQARAEIDKLLPLLACRAHERFAIGTQHVNRRDHYSPKREHRGDLKKMKALDYPAVLKRTKEDHDLAGEVRETGKTDRSEYPKSKGEPGEGHHSGKTAEFIEN